jgi:SAM-dependent methyltransferase
MHHNSILLFEKYALSLFRPAARVLEVGPDVFPSSYQQKVKVPCEWHTLDMTGDERLTYRASEEYAFPIEADSYDIVLSGQVIEHVRKPWRWMPELARVTKPGGLVITINPVSWPFHEAPLDCWRIYPDGMRALCEDSSLTVMYCAFGSLETSRFKRFIPGVSAGGRGKKWRLVNQFLGRFGLPVERAYDTITIARK